jgi:hypothetical protein
MNDLERVRAFIDGAKTGIDWLNHKGALREGSPTEYENGFRHCLDAIGGFIDDLDEEKAAPEAMTP